MATLLFLALQNATTIASKFRDLYGLELALKQELRELTRAQVRGQWHPCNLMHALGLLCKLGRAAVVGEPPPESTVM